MVHGQGARVRRVGFRDGTDEELAALHSVEAPVETERGSNRMPRHLNDYIAFARSLPSQFDDHAWLAEDPGSGEPVAAAYCWSHSAGDPQVMECDVLVRPERRRQGIGSDLVAAIRAETAHEGRSLLTWSTFDRVPAGEAFSRQLRAHVARVNRTSELRIAKLDEDLIDGWMKAARPRELGYTLEAIDGPFPENRRDDAVRFHHIMQTAPREDLRVTDTTINADFVAELDRALVDAGRTRWTLLVRDPTGVCVGGTEVVFEAPDQETAYQQNTGIDPAHRGLGLAKWAKAAMLHRITCDRPEVSRVQTGNAFSNEPMLAINQALGFAVVATRTEWQLETSRDGNSPT